MDEDLISVPMSWRYNHVVFNKLGRRQFLRLCMGTSIESGLADNQLSIARCENIFWLIWLHCSVVGCRR